jgi:hypothetical protein
MRSHLTLLLLGVVCLAPAVLLDAQTTPFFDKSRPDAERLRAVQSLGYPDERTKEALFAVGADRTQSDAIRWEALRRLQYGLKYREVVLQILANPNDGGEQLDADLIRDLARKTAFRLPVEDQQRIQSVERVLLSDTRDRVRLEAYRVLVSNHDAVAINRLVDGLRGGVAVPIPLPDAIELLDDDGAVSYISVLRPYLDHKDPRVQARAARALALDPDSRPQIVRLAVNGASPEEVRFNALRGLAREDSGFLEYAIAIVANRQESPEIRKAAMHEIVGRMNYNPVRDEVQVRFAQTVEALAGERGAKLQDEARRVLAYLKQAFPAIKKFYATR